MKYTFRVIKANNYKATVESWLRQIIGPGTTTYVDDHHVWRIIGYYPLSGGFSVHFKEEKHLSFFLLKFGHLR